MASKASRWAVEDDDEGEQQRRKKEKEEKRRLKEQRARQAASPPSLPDIAGADSEPPSKRRRISPPPVQPESQPSKSVQVDDDSHLLSFPSSGFGPSNSVSEYTILNPIEEGSYGHVSRARHNASQHVVALKKLKMDNVSEGFPVTALREIQVLRACSHPHVVALREVVVGESLSE
jgi:cell division cycle 2-like protein